MRTGNVIINLVCCTDYKVTVMTIMNKSKIKVPTAELEAVMSSK